MAFQCFSYRRYFGVIVPHQKAALFTARQAELVDVMDQMLYYLKVQIYLPYSDVPRLVSYLLESIVCRSQYPMQDSLMFESNFDKCFKLLVVYYCFVLHIVIHNSIVDWSPFICQEFNYIECHHQTVSWVLIFPIHFQNIITNDMPRLSVFDLFRETDADFLARSNWTYTAQSPVYVPNPMITIQGPAPGAPPGP